MMHKNQILYSMPFLNTDFLQIMWDQCRIDRVCNGQNQPSRPRGSHGKNQPCWPKMALLTKNGQINQKQPYRSKMAVPCRKFTASYIGTVVSTKNGHLQKTAVQAKIGYVRQKCQSQPNPPVLTKNSQSSPNQHYIPRAAVSIKIGIDALNTY